MAGIGRLEHHVGELLAYLERNQGALVHYAARCRNGEPISTAFVESAVNEIIANRSYSLRLTCVNQPPMRCGAATEPITPRLLLVQPRFRPYREGARG